ncbi:MAG: MarR family transcriptional regulator [Oscillospiraceae bacterium]|nr:MarR family transcriptional regulator [Oscillospiraceae bacterium]
MAVYQIGYKLRVLNNLIKRYFDFSSHKNQIEKVTGNNGCIIGFLAESEAHGREVFQKDIEEHFHITRSTVSNVLSLMERKGLIERQSVPRGARLKKIVLTQKAEPYKNFMREDEQKMNELLTKGFSDEELQTLCDYIERMKKNISQE